MRPVISVVVPCYNEEAALPHSVNVLMDTIKSMDVAPESRLVLVDDGSRDHTWQLIERYHKEEPRIQGLKLTHNRGQQNALWAGLMECRAISDAVITIDCDLQDDPAAMREMVEKFKQGCDIVYGVRSSRHTDTAFKRTTAHAYYGIMKKLGVDLVYDHSEYRLMSRRALDALSEYGEVNLFLRAMVPTLGFTCDKVYYERRERVAGESKYPLGKMMSLAMQGITSFSDKPLVWITDAGIAGIIASAAALLACLIACLCGADVRDLAWILLCLWLMGSVQLTAIGVVGQYVGRNYMETKHRPRYLLDKRLTDGE